MLHHGMIELKRQIIFDFPQICRVNASLVVVVIQTEMVSSYTNGRNTLSLPEIGRRLSEIPKCGSDLQKVHFCARNVLQSTVMEQQDMARSCGYLPQLREYAMPMIKQKKQLLLETVTPSLPSYQRMYMGNNPSRVSMLILAHFSSCK